MFNSQALISLLAQMEISCTDETLCCVLLADIKKRVKKELVSFHVKIFLPIWKMKEVLLVFKLSIFLKMKIILAKRGSD